MKRGYWIGILAGLFIILFCTATYFTFIYVKKCSNMECFNSELIKCNRASVIDDKEDGAWKYQIIDRDKNKCIINVKLVQLKEGTSNILKFQGTSMNCVLPYGKVAVPQSDLENCHGLLKEEMQKMMLNKLYNYITENLGQLSEELTKQI